MKFKIIIQPTTRQEQERLIAIADAHGLTIYIDQDGYLEIRFQSPLIFVFITQVLAQYYAEI